MSSSNTFHLGICMAGAVSAGAYTAGVIDYLLETLDNWEDAKRLQKEGKLTGVPTHGVNIGVISGASAGGMTAAITAAAIQNKFTPMDTANRGKDNWGTQNPLYNAWVNLTETSSQDMMDQMLLTNDIINCKEVRAGFNSSFITEIADNILTKAVKEDNYNRPYIAGNLDLFTTITNLRGFNYQVSFHTTQGIREHRMRMHKDIAFFRLDDDGKNTLGRIPLSFKGAGINKAVLAQAAMATGAFPVGLESRELTRKRDDILNNKYLNLYLSNNNNGLVNYNFLPEGEFESLNVDGGVINNEPFEITQQLLDDRRRAEIAAGGDEEGAANYKIKVAAKEFDTTVIMVDPFPNDDEPVADRFSSLKAWKFALPKILSAMRGQLMLKETEIQKAYLSDDYTRFLISPVRTENGKKMKYAIACGSFGGFGGFFSKKFREHDFYLGRRNCQRFLQMYFSVPAAAQNEIIETGYAGIKSAYQFAHGDNDDDSKTKVGYLPIIPDRRVKFNKETGVYVYETTPVEEKFDYPKISLKYLLGIQDKFEKRVKCILDNITQGVDPSATVEPHPILSKIRKKSFFSKLFSKVTQPLTSLYLSIGKSQGKGIIAEKFIDSVIVDMDKRNLLTDDV